MVWNLPLYPTERHPVSVANVHAIPVELAFSAVFIPRSLTLLLSLSNFYYWKFIMYIHEYIGRISARVSEKEKSQWLQRGKKA